MSMILAIANVKNGVLSGSLVLATAERKAALLSLVLNGWTVSQAVNIVWFVASRHLQNK